MTQYRVEESHDPREVPVRVALIRRETPARVLVENGELLPTAPHLLLREVILIEAVLVVLALASLAFDAPLEGIADPQHTPNPAKAPWYFLGLQELLHYFPPVVAGVLLPTLVVIALVAIPYFQVNASVEGVYERPWKTTVGIATAVVAGLAVLLATFRVWPVLVPTVLVYALLGLPALGRCPPALRRRLGRVPLADWIMIWFVAVTVVLTAIGVLFRGPGWSWTWPWLDRIY